MKKDKNGGGFHDDRDLFPGSEGGDVPTVQSLLLAMGHLRGSFAPGKVCQRTERAIRRYQRFYNLKPDGIVGPITKAQLLQPRCGVPDIPVVRAASPTTAPYVLRGCSYPRNVLTYAFLNGTSDLPGSREREIVREAFDVWAKVANLHFEEKPPSQTTDFQIAWRSGNHGDGDGFDGPGRILAHAFFPPPCGGVHAGSLHFDEGETWIDDPSGTGILLRQVAIHEIGHLLGLSHSDDEGAIMYAYYGPDRVNLNQDDIAGIQALYGAPESTSKLQLETQLSGNLARTGEEQHYEITPPTTLSITIDGPADADFDLYLRKGAKPTQSEWDQRAYTASSDEEVVFVVEPGATYNIMVRSYSGSGDYTLNVKPGTA